MTTLQQIYICDTCGALSRKGWNPPAGWKKCFYEGCKGQLRAAFYADDLQKLLDTCDGNDTQYKFEQLLESIGHEGDE